jgi:tRNA-splicing ligase RtcB
MNKVISTEKIPIKLWLDDIEEGALEQAKHLANLPFAIKHIAIMPDSHQGYGMPIGGVMATKGVIVPNAVGKDIGCGMCAVRTSLTEIDLETLKKIMGEIRKQIPVGFGHHKESQDPLLMPDHSTQVKGYEGRPIVAREWNNALTQIGTLGGGNHFIEIQKVSDGHIWIMIHSGSRNFGLKIADYYNKLAKQLNEKWHSGIDPKWDLAFLPIDSDEGQAYIREMNYAVDFALASRQLMMRRILCIFEDVVYDKIDLETTSTRSSVYDISHYEPIINIAHNYAKMENHFGENVMVHRKGATLATTDTIGIIPGSQGSKSYIVKGKGNPESFNSCSHGAGRKMGRKEAERSLNLADEIKKLNDQGIIHGIRGIHDLDEAAGAYKEISEVMKNQEDLVEILVELSPLAVIKG